MYKITFVYRRKISDTKYDITNRSITVSKIQVAAVPVMAMVAWFDDPPPYGAEIVSIYILNKSQQ